MKKSILVLCAIVIGCLMCQSCHKKEKVTTPKITKEQSKKIKNVNVSIIRYEQDLFNLNPNHLSDGVKQLYGKYPENLVSKTAGPMRK